MRPQGTRAGLNLFENVDVYVNNHLPEGDACIAVEGVSQHMGPMSTYCNCFAIDCIMMKAAEKLAADGIDPPIWMSANMPGGDAANKALEGEILHESQASALKERNKSAQRIFRR